MTDSEIDVQRRAVDRLAVFSDAVVAIAITLLAIDLPIPAGSTTSKFWSSVRDNDGHYAAFAISFMAIAGAWSHHHDLYRYTRSIDTRLRSLNTAWLLSIALNPFATKLLTSNSQRSLAVHGFRFGFYSLVQAGSAGAMLALVHHMATRDQVPGLPPSEVGATTWQSAGLLIGFGLSIPVFFATTYGWVLWFAGPLIVRQVYRARHRT